MPRWEQKRCRAVQVSAAGYPLFLLYVSGCGVSLQDTRWSAGQLANSGTMPSGTHKAFMVSAFEPIKGKIVIPNVGLLVNAYVAHTKSHKGFMMKGSDLEHYDLNLLAQHGSRDVNRDIDPPENAESRKRRPRDICPPISPLASFHLN